MITIRIWSGSSKSRPSSSLLEKARNLKMPECMAYRMDDGSFLICFPSYSNEQVESFEKLLQDEQFGIVPSGQAGLLKTAHYSKIL